MATVTSPHSERRTEQRFITSATPWQPDAILRPGIPVIVLDISTRAVMFESEIRLRPGMRTEIQLMTEESRASVRGHLVRCHVYGLGPLRYRGVLMFDELVDLGLPYSG